MVPASLIMSEMSYDDVGFVLFGVPSLATIGKMALGPENAWQLMWIIAPVDPSISFAFHPHSNAIQQRPLKVESVLN